MPIGMFSTCHKYARPHRFKTWFMDIFSKRVDKYTCNIIRLGFKQHTIVQISNGTTTKYSHFGKKERIKSRNFKIHQRKLRNDLILWFWSFGSVGVVAHSLQRCCAFWLERRNFMKILRGSLVNVLVPILQVKHVFSTGHRNLVHCVFFHRAITFMLQNCLCSQ